MPKVVTTSSSRRLRANSPAHLQSAAPVRHSPIFAAAPRKVSFEDGHHSSSSFTSSTSSSAQVTGSTSCSSIASSLSSSKSSLRRKAPSVCLVGLAAEEESQPHCLSPTPDQHHPGTAPSSPWGHFVDILVPLDEEDEPATKRRLLGDDAPLFGFFEPEEDNASTGSGGSWIPSLVGNKRHKTRRRWGAPHPYALQPRHRRQRRFAANAKPSFLPGFFLEGDRTTESSETKEVETALQRLRV